VPAVNRQDDEMHFSDLGIKVRPGINARNPAQVIGKVGIAMQLRCSLPQQHRQHQQQSQAKLHPVTGRLQSY
jgi:hypothetical protein